MSLRGKDLVYDWGMQLMMNDIKLTTIEEVKQFLAGSKTVTFEGVSTEERYLWMESVFVRFKYSRLNRAEKGVIRQYLEKVSGYSRAQVSRLTRQYYQQGRLRKADSKRHHFPTKYTHKDIVLLAKTDELHQYLSGPATKKIMEREWASIRAYGLQEYLSDIGGSSLQSAPQLSLSEPDQTIHQDQTRGGENR
jgi:hypothetical protein